MSPANVRRSPPLFALAITAVTALACAHAPAASVAAQPASKPQLAAEASKSPAQPLGNEVASGRAALDVALAKLRGVSVFFKFDEATLTSEAEEKLAAVGDVLRAHAPLVIRVEGNCDERGSEQYNLALGQRRAEAAKRYLVKLGAAPEQVTTVSYGNERPRAVGHDEQAWSQNRRDDVVPR